MGKVEVKMCGELTSNNHYNVRFKFNRDFNVNFEH